jgi:exonuclease VII small subunit
MQEQPTKKEYARQRANQIVIRFSDEELAELNQAIAESGLSKTDFFLQLLRKKNIIIVSDLKEICVELKRQGINLNQALRHYHETGFAEKIKTAINNCNELYEKAKNIFLESETKIQKAQKKKRAGQQKNNKDGED